MNYSNGYAGNILFVNLTNKMIKNVPTVNYSPLFLGGRGIAAKIYLDEVPPDISPFDPENHLIFMTDPVSTTTGFCGFRWQIGGKPPAHNMFCYCNMGGTWGGRLKMAGYDGLVVSGSSDKPVYLWISIGEIKIRPADQLIGKGAIDCRESLNEKLGKADCVVAIGQAGENQMRG